MVLTGEQLWGVRGGGGGISSCTEDEMTREGSVRLPNCMLNVHAFIQPRAWVSLGKQAPPMLLASLVILVRSSSPQLGDQSLLSQRE